MLNHIDTIATNHPNGFMRFVLGAASALALTLCASGCVARADVTAEPVYGYSTVWVDTPPAEVRTYPRYDYNGRYAYLVNDQWYYDSPRGWVTFRTEPRELSERRVYIGRHSAPAPHARPRYYEERRVPASPRPREPTERGRRYYPR